MKPLITYEKQCVLCKNLKTYTLRDADVNQMNDKEEVNLAKIINLLDRWITFPIQAREKLSRLHKEYVGNTNVGVDKEAGR